MDFNDLIDDIGKMTGMTLSSIVPGSDITILSVDADQKCVSIRTKTGKKVSRPFTELKTLWNALNSEPIVHVENALHGSGSSRNQPETILANLPYIEWLRYDRKKHIAYVGKETHPIGTLKKMSSMDVAKISSELGNDSDLQFSALIVSSDITETSKAISQRLGTALEPVSEGYYDCSVGDFRILVCTESVCSLHRGSYSSAKSPHPMQLVDAKVEILGDTYDLVNVDGCKILVRD